MLPMFKKFLSLSLLVSTGAVLAEDCNNSCNNDCDTPAKPITCFVPRSQSFHNELKNAAMDPDNQFLYDVDGFNGSFNIMFEYDHTFNSDKLGKCLFGQAAVCTSACGDDAVALNVVGSNAATKPNGTSDLVADNFFLPKDFSSTIIVKPSIQNFNVHLQAYFGFDEWCTGLYARIYAPITVSKWKLETTEKVAVKGTEGYVAGEIAPVAMPTTELNDSFLAYTQGGANYSLLGSTTPLATAPTVQALKYTRFGSCDSDTTTQLADLRAELGWNFLLDEDYHLGLYIAAAAPTANDCEDDCNTLLWGAKAGNGAHWELGGGLTGHYTLWRAEDCEQQFDFFVDATINHMFKHTEQRTFDLVSKPLSRYIIAEQLTSTITNGLTVGGADATYQFAGAYAPVANLTTQDVSVSFPVQADVMAKFVYTCKGFSWALGYDFWAQACPDIEVGCNDDCDATPAFEENKWALRGNAHVYGFRNPGTTPTNDLIQPIPATFAADNAFVLGNAYGAGSNNGSVDGTPAVTNAGGALFNAPNSTTTAINGSTNPVFIKATDIDINNVTRGLSNSIFTEMNYTWIDRECWVPYLGIGARVEFGSNGSGNNNNTAVTTTTTTLNSCDNDCNNCDTCTATVWGIWIKGGLSFN